jgi:hypothetical protein
MAGIRLALAEAEVCSELPTYSQLVEDNMHGLLGWSSAPLRCLLDLCLVVVVLCVSGF